jgi:predicted DNA-binding transcriptional regulator AlpA
MRHTKEGANGILPVRYFTPADVADLLGVPIDTVYQWRYKRTGPPGFRVGRYLRYDPQAVLDWIAQFADGAA